MVIKMSNIKIHGPSFSTYVRTIRMIAHEKGLSYELVPVQLGSEEHNRFHPFGKMPVLEVGDQKFHESLAMAIYLDETFEGIRLQPSTVLDKARMFQSISQTCDYGYQAMIRQFVLPKMGFRQESDDSVAAGTQETGRQLGLLDTELQESEYLAGTELSLADLFLLPHIYWVGTLPEGRELLEGKDALNRWYALMEKRDSFAKTIPQM